MTDDVRVVEPGRAVSEQESRREDRSEEWTTLTGLGVLGGWIALQWWVLPRLGVPT